MGIFHIIPLVTHNIVIDVNNTMGVWLFNIDIWSSCCKIWLQNKVHAMEHGRLLHDWNTMSWRCDCFVGGNASNHVSIHLYLGPLHLHECTFDFTRHVYLTFAMMTVKSSLFRHKITLFPSHFVTMSCSHLLKPTCIPHGNYIPSQVKMK